MLLIANGCSHTAGAEIEYELQGHCYDKAWPKLLADRFGFDHLNLSYSGASCDRVVRTSLETLHKFQSSKNYDPSNLFFVVMWPGIWRTEMFEIEKEELGFFDNGWMPMVSGNDETYQKQASKTAYMNYKSWVLRSSITSESINFFKNVLLLQNILISNKIKYLFLNSCQSLPSTMPEYVSQIYKKRYFEFDSSEESYTIRLEKEGFSHSPVSKYAHWGEDAQDWWATHLFNHIKENKLI